MLFLLGRENGEDFKKATNFNEKDIEDIPKEVKSKLNIITADHIRDVISKAIR
jgi:ATP-dependent Lon protease